MPIVGRGGYEWQTIKFPRGLNGCQFLRKYSCNKNSPQNIADREMRTFPYPPSSLSLFKKITGEKVFMH
jgi:hypothetical protein